MGEFVRSWRVFPRGGCSCGAATKGRLGRREECGQVTFVARFVEVGVVIAAVVQSYTPLVHTSCSWKRGSTCHNGSVWRSKGSVLPSCGWKRIHSSSGKEPQVLSSVLIDELETKGSATTETDVLHVRQPQTTLIAAQDSLVRPKNGHHQPSSQLGTLTKHNGSTLTNHNGATLTKHNGATLTKHNGATLTKRNGATLTKHNGSVPPNKTGRKERKPKRIEKPALSRDILSKLLQRSVVEEDALEQLDALQTPEEERSKPSTKRPKLRKRRRRYAARTITGLIVALAEEAEGLRVDVDARKDSPFWRKDIKTLRINFSRLGFKPLRMGSLDDAFRDVDRSIPTFEKDEIATALEKSSSDLYKLSHPADTQLSIPTADEAFSRIDADNSGALDEAELAHALTMAASLEGEDGPELQSTFRTPTAERRRIREILSRLASKLVKLYDVNGDGVVDREEYRSMVRDMAALRRRSRRRRERASRKKRRSLQAKPDSPSWWRKLLARLFAFTLFFRRREVEGLNDTALLRDEVTYDASATDLVNDTTLEAPPQQSESTTPVSEEDGSIVLSDVKLDLRQLVFGAIPFLKKITPGGPLILEPLRATVIGSFNREDVMDSFLLDAGLRRLVARALRLRVRSIRDSLDGAVFFGRTWNMASKTAPFVEVPKLTNVEFDSNDRMIITGRARVRAGPGQPFIENAFKLRARFGTRKHGQVIRLQNPELALVLECPRTWERGIESACKNFGLPVPTRPAPICTFFPLISPFRASDQDGGFDLGVDNRIKSIYIKNGALRFEISAVLRPGRFLGNHYLAFTVPNRTFIVTLDRVREGIRVARRNKAKAKRAAREAARVLEREESKPQEVVAGSLSTNRNMWALTPGRKLGSVRETGQEFNMKQAEAMGKADETSSARENLTPKKPSFLSRFVEGYKGAKREDWDAERSERLLTAISEWFGQQDGDSEENDVILEQ